MSSIVCWVIQAYSLVIVARILLEWIQVSSDHPVAQARRVLRVLTDPILIPVRRLLPPIRAGGAGLDLSPMVVIVGLWILASIICR